MIGRTMDGPASGQLATGSANVMVNRLPATMIYLASGDCSHHGPIPAPRVASGSETVRINGRPAARITELMDCDAVIRTGSPNVNIGGPRESPVCSALRSEEAKHGAAAPSMRQASQAAYESAGDTRSRSGWAIITQLRLNSQKLGLSQALIEHPIDQATGKPSEFRAAVFTSNDILTGAPIIAYQGDDADQFRQDWRVNARVRSLGHDTFYYDQSQKYVAQRVAEDRRMARAQVRV